MTAKPVTGRRGLTLFAFWNRLQEVRETEKTICSKPLCQTRSGSGCMPSLWATGLGGHIFGPNERDHAISTERVERVVATGLRGLGGEAAAPERAVDQVGDFLFFDAVHLLDQQADLSHRLIRGFIQDEPQPVAVAGVAFPLSLDPGLGLLARVALGVVLHDFGIGQHRGDEVEVVGRHLAENQARRFQ